LIVLKNVRFLKVHLTLILHKT